MQKKFVNKIITTLIYGASSILILLCIGWSIGYFFWENYGSDKSLIGLSETEILKKFNKPVAFKESDGNNRDISYIGTRPVLPNSILSSNINIREYVFVYRSFITLRKNYLSVWLIQKNNKWVAIDSFWYNESVNF